MRSSRATSKIHFYLIILTVTFLALAVIAMVLRKYLANPIEPSAGEAVFSLSDLRRMHRDGELTDDEYLAARAAALAESGVQVEGAALPADGPGKPKGPAGVDLGPELLSPDDLDAPPTPEKPDEDG